MAGKTEYHIHVQGNSSAPVLNLKEVWRYRDLIVLFTKRTLAVMYKQTILGPAWLVLHPLLTSVIYAAVFKGIAGMSTEGTPTLLFYLVGHALWNFFASSLKRNASAFAQNAGIFGKVYFPRLTLSISSMLTALIEFLIEFVLILILILFYAARGQVLPRWDLIWLLPALFLQTGLLGLGCGLIVSSLTTKYRDLKLLVDFGVSLWMYITPVIYPLSQVHTGSMMRQVMAVNPMTLPMELFRLILLGRGVFSQEYLFTTSVCTIVVLITGGFLFSRIEKNFIDTI